MNAPRPLRRNRRPTHPGVILREHYLVPRKILQKHFADDVEISEKHLSRIINGHARIDAPLAARIAKTLGTTTLFWVNLQASVDAWDGEQAEADWQPQTVYPPERAAS
ncbi:MULTISPECIES: HigA family addiction module antitoxin [Thalassospira]|jgi:addiction module HigA family antidote|uniref:XRE family transcriptional regulator n=1 Tax=Thalassospira xiamenensis TaxID=220697 RepID=A0ABR5XWY6_9PROT|nr:MULTISPECIES: HigA family addiction module antitoxin [Thalassospira]MAL30647.1 addiction module antidote protein, HigA family [Thalassospira sp.]MBR9778706.1 HigA family addiction module antidote protein [Rhodospirillales bacterium]KZC97361.1 XRE family transcriptional regulator [Thalassospira xiamenensis]KZD10042.1 XRE family transcriptional regulator [Thalassospira xiamenensis]MBR9817147.1 HigA family addiction module antidote protein [Rhodospirillales bacterium]|tara:strand:- start:5929 stop:6252 length:324 start_codon:yes stop_codon:yes gene_type:complete